MQSVRLWTRASAAALCLSSTYHALGSAEAKLLIIEVCLQSVLSSTCHASGRANAKLLITKEVRGRCLFTDTMLCLSGLKQQ